MSCRASPFGEAVALLDDAITARVAPGAQLSVRWREHGAWQCWDYVTGRLAYGPDADVTTVDTQYDLASVTKALVALAWVRFANREKLSLRAPLSDVFKQARGQAVGHVSIEQLLAHRAGLPAWRAFYAAIAPEEAAVGGVRGRIVARVVQTELEPAAAGQAVYSDVGYMLLGEALAEMAMQSLSLVVAREVLRPLGLAARVNYRGVTGECASAAIAPTEYCAWRRRIVQGTVHDENAHVLEGTAGHAGLFGTARDVCEIGRATLDSLREDTAWYSRDVMRAMVAPRPGGSHRLGWDGKSGQGSSAGTRMSAETFGHLGFTGTSLWCDPRADVAIALVCNRIHPTRTNAAIRALRPGLHDAVMYALDG